METNNSLHTGCRTLVIKMLNELRGKIDEFSENLHKEIENIKRISEK